MVKNEKSAINSINEKKSNKLVLCSQDHPLSVSRSYYRSSFPEKQENSFDNERLNINVDANSTIFNDKDQKNPSFPFNSFKGDKDNDEVDNEDNNQKVKPVKKRRFNPFTSNPFDEDEDNSEDDSFNSDSNSVAAPQLGSGISSPAPIHSDNNDVNVTSTNTTPENNGNPFRMSPGINGSATTHAQASNNESGERIQAEYVDRTIYNHIKSEISEEDVKLFYKYLRKQAWKRFIFFLLASAIYFSVFFLGILQAFGALRGWDQNILLMGSLIAVLVARGILLGYSVIQFTNLKNKNNWLDIIANFTVLTSFTIATAVQLIAVTSVACGSTKIIHDSNSYIHGKGVVDIICIAMRLFIAFPIAVYSRYIKYQGFNKQKHLESAKDNDLGLNNGSSMRVQGIYLLSMIFLFDMIALGGKVIHTIEQNGRFPIQIEGSFPFVGLLIRIVCLIALVTLFIQDFLFIEEAIEKNQDNNQTIKAHKFAIDQIYDNEGFQLM